MVVGADGLAQVDLVIPQGTTFSVQLVHKDDEGRVIDHSTSTADLSVKARGGRQLNLSDCCTCTSQGVYVLMPPSRTERLPLGRLLWDVMVTTSGGEVVRLAYGTVRVVDTYAKDE